MTITLIGQIRGGKNSVKTTREGRRYPSPVFAKWRDAAVTQAIAQYFPQNERVVAVPSRATIRYWPGDARKRDVPALMDGIWHVLERAGVVKDDALLQEVHWLPMDLDRKSPRATICMEPLCE